MRRKKNQVANPFSVFMDPGAKTGVAVFTGKKLTDLRTFKWSNLLDIMSFIRGYAELQQATFYIELANKGAPRFKRAGVAQVQQKAKTLKALAEGFGAEVVMLPPQYQFTKIDAQQFTTYHPHWGGRTSEHSRDAAMLGWVTLR